MDDATASPASTASAGASGSASASPTSTATSSPTPAPSKELPDTGGIPLVPMLSAMVLALLIGSAAVATILLRRTS